MELGESMFSEETLRTILEAGAFGILVLFGLMGFRLLRELRATGEKVRTELIDMIERMTKEARAEMAAVLEMAQKEGQAYREEIRHLIDKLFDRIDGKKDD